MVSSKEMLRCWCFFLLSCYAIGLFIFMFGLLPVDDLPNAHKGAANRKSHQYNRIILVIVDGMRPDLLFSRQNSKHWPNARFHMQSKQAICSISDLNPPTVTLPRIKAITSGRTPKFVDVIYNLNAHTDNTDSWIQRLSESGLRLSFYGDDTWLKIFPNSFTQSEGTTSFFVNDYYEVDTNITRHLDQVLASPNEWDVLILHYLGLDHIGHVEGPRGSSMPAKLEEMDAVVGKILGQLTQSANFAKDWLFILTGDHGMSDQGGHGGSSQGEVTTALFMLSAELNRTDSSTKTCELPLETMVHSQQVDLATLIGLATGSGIPSSSKGFLSDSWLHNLWPSKPERLAIVSELLVHVAANSDCSIDSGRYSNLLPDRQIPVLDWQCSSKLLSSQQVQLFNNLSESIKLWFDCRSNMTDLSKSNCGHYLLDSSADSIIQDSMKFINQVQTQLMKKAEHLNVVQMLIGCVLMWLITLFLFVKNIIDFSTLSQTKIKVVKQDNIELPTAHEPSVFADESVQFRFVKLVCLFGMTVLLVQAFSSASSSFAEEEYQLWYNFSRSLLILILSLVFLIGVKTKRKWRITGLLLVLLGLDRFMLSCLHHTGYKWINLPDWSDWLYEPAHSQWLWISQLLGWTVVLGFRFRALQTHPSRAKSNWFGHWCPLLTCCLVIAIQLAYRYTIAASQRDWMITTARLGYLSLLADLICLRSSRLSMKHQTTSQTPRTRLFYEVTLHEISTLPLLVCLLGRPAVGILWIGVFLKEALLCEAIQLLFDRGPIGARELSFNALDVTTWLIYWAQGWVTYFQQGNSLSLTTIDVTAGYVGLSHHQPLIAGPLLAFYTYAGPIFWQLAYFSRFSLPQIQRISVKFSFLVLAFLILPITCCATFCFYLREHLFIWTVFTPKMLYMAVFFIVFAPFSCFWCYKASY